MKIHEMYVLFSIFLISFGALWVKMQRYSEILIPYFHLIPNEVITFRYFCNFYFINKLFCLIKYPLTFNFITFNRCQVEGILNVEGLEVGRMVAFLHTVVIATVITCRVRNPACTASSALGKEGYVNG